jgi:subtilase family serine protease
MPLTGTRPVPALEPGAVSTGTVTVTVPTTTTVGTYYLLACADGQAVVAESNEANNCIASGIVVEITP